LEAALPGGVGIPPGPSERPARLRRLGCRSPRAETQSTHARWLKQYLPLVEAGTWAWLEIGESNFLPQPLPKGVVASAFANREIHLVLANYSPAATEITTSDPFVPVGEQGGVPARKWNLGPRSLQILRRCA